MRGYHIGLILHCIKDSQWIPQFVLRCKKGNLRTIIILVDWKSVTCAHLLLLHRIKNKKAIVESNDLKEMKGIILKITPFLIQHLFLLIWIKFHNKHRTLEIKILCYVIPIYFFIYISKDVSSTTYWLLKMLPWILLCLYYVVVSFFIFLIIVP